MRSVFVCACLMGALCAPALADPIAIDPDAYALSQNAYAAAVQQSSDAYGERYAQAAQPSLGGGLLEFLFGGAQAATSSQPAPAPYQPVQSFTPAPGYPPQQAYAPQQVYEPQQPYAPQQGYPQQQVYAPQQADAPQGYAPSSQGDMAHPQVDPKFDRQVVAYDGSEVPGTIIIDTPNKFLFLVEDHGKAMRYGIGVGRPGFTWAGVKTITSKREWPDWYPPSDMLARRPDLPRYMAGGPENPLGARAMYLGSTLYRIHGSNEPWTIGTNVSSGCIRLRNQDVIDLYERVKVGTKVVVL
jgi:lipoprotein-anchoring transpeptidase ErfK/SrfK